MHLVVHAESYVTVRFVRKHRSALATLEREPPFLRVAALTRAFSLCSLVTELPAWTTSQLKNWLTTNKVTTPVLN